MPETIDNGTRQEIDGNLCVYYDGYWIKCYEPPEDGLAAKKRLIEALTRRLFNHVEHGINIPGRRLDEARRAYDREEDPDRKRVKGGMLAGALFNRAADIFTKVVELQELGVGIEPDDPLLRECGTCLQEALDLGRLVRHRGGDEGIDELWGEPFKAFCVSVEDFYESRYIKIAQTMRDIDHVADRISRAVASGSLFPELPDRMREFAEAAKLKCEVLRTDPIIFDVWPAFVVAGERICQLDPKLHRRPSVEETQAATEGRRLIHEGVALITHMARARVPMPKSRDTFLDRCDRYAATRQEGACRASRCAIRTD
jgi:hypothetical protein